MQSRLRGTHYPKGLLYLYIVVQVLVFRVYSSANDINRYVVLTAARSGSGWFIRMLDSNPMISSANHEPLGSAAKRLVHVFLIWFSCFQCETV